MEKKLQKSYPTNYNLLIAQDLQKVYHQILLKNLAEEVHKIKCKYGHSNKKSKTCGIKKEKIVSALSKTKTLKIT